jgi:abortive infection bacteriophage resistance protein
VIHNENYAKEILLRENYFFLNDYRHSFMKSQNRKIYITGTSFEEQYSLLKFDRNLRNIMFKNILIIENNTKSITAYQLSKKYGYKEDDYLKITNFNKNPNKRKQEKDLLKKMKRQIRTNAIQHEATRHYVMNYGYIPFWVLVKVLSFGIVSELFTILKTEDQSEIVEIYQLQVDDYEVYLAMLSNYRNLCAHEDIMYNNRTQRIISDTRYHKTLNIPLMDNEYTCGKNDLFALMIILKSLLKAEEVKDMFIEVKDEISNLEYNLRTIPVNKIMDEMGFPGNWMELSTIPKGKLF